MKIRFLRDFQNIEFLKYSNIKKDIFFIQVDN